MRPNPQTYAVTIICAGRERVFLHTDFFDVMIQLLARYRNEQRFLLHGFVLMPDHIHLLLSPAKSLEASVGVIKGGFAFMVRKKWRNHVWQDGYYSHRVIDGREFDSQLTYIAANPERWGYQNYLHTHVSHPEMIDSRPSHLGG